MGLGSMVMVSEGLNFFFFCSEGGGDLLLCG
jgi:hypothetical protein